MQVLAEASAQVPAEQDEQAFKLAPIVVKYVPARHNTQVVDPEDEENEPATQLKQRLDVDAPAVDEYVPAAQFKQYEPSGAPVEVDQEPARHNEHVDEPCVAHVPAPHR